ncbi:MAG: hypothetical protein JNJ58_06240 [Chitinophagaceae bacterium]|nr:hypothetical protein [Chitinophagaceae bacterium]
MARIILFILLLNHWNALAQIGSGYQVNLKPLNINGFDGIQSFSAGQINGEWVLIGGRTDGLHRRQPPVTFLAAGNNQLIYVINPTTQQLWTASVNTLPTSLAEQLQSTNMQFSQRDNTLYLTGGYGYSATALDHITYDKLTAVKLDSLVWAIKNAQSIVPYFRQITDSRVAVTGGHLGRIGQTFYLVGGNKFDGRYNPMGGASYTQVYTNQIRKFEINDNGQTMSIGNYIAINDSQNLHRRDYNLLPQIFPGQVEGFTAFSGVFQYNVDLPYLNSVDITATGHTVNNTFSQYLNHYHSAKCALYDSLSSEMQNVFFGGISQYYDSAGIIVQNNDVPFTKAITLVKRNSVGVMTENKIAEMPGYLGASAEFIINKNIPHTEHEIIRVDQIAVDSILIGYIVGGINSSAPLIFLTNTGTQSNPLSTIYEVWLKRSPSAVTAPVELSILTQFQVYPNPSLGQLNVKFYNPGASHADIRIKDAIGRSLAVYSLDHLQIGENLYSFNLPDHQTGSIFIELCCQEKCQTLQMLSRQPK